MLLPLLLALSLQGSTPAAPPAPPAPPPPPSARPAPDSSGPADPLRGDWSKPSGRRVTVTGSLTADEALDKIADAAGWSVVLNTGDAGDTTLTLKLRDVPAEDALRAVLTGAGLVAARSGSTVTVTAGGLPALLGEAGRQVEEAMHQAEEAGRKATRHLEDEESRIHGQDREVTGSDCTVSPGEEVRDVNVVKGNLVVKSGATVRDAAVVLGSLTVEPGATVRSAVSVLGSTTLGEGATAREAVAVLGNLTLGPGASVEEDVVSVGGQIHRDPGSHVGGGITSISFPSLGSMPGKLSLRLVPKVSSPLALILGTLVRFAVLFVLGLIVMSVVPRRAEAVSGAMVAKPWHSLFAGVLGAVGMVVLAVLLVVTVVGALLLPVQILLILGGSLLGIVALVHHLGHLLPIPQTRRTMVAELAAGTLVFSVLTAIPFLGSMVWMATWFLGFGAVLRTRFGQPPVLPTMPAPPAPAA